MTRPTMSARCRAQVTCESEGCTERPAYHVATAEGPKLLCPECAAEELARPTLRVLRGGAA